jgi:hypothetical protein
VKRTPCSCGTGEKSDLPLYFLNVHIVIIMSNIIVCPLLSRFLVHCSRKVFHAAVSIISSRRYIFPSSPLVHRRIRARSYMHNNFLFDAEDRSSSTREREREREILSDSGLTFQRNKILSALRSNKTRITRTTLYENMFDSPGNMAVGIHMYACENKRTRLWPLRTHT